MNIIQNDKRCVTLLHTYATSSTPRCDVYYMGLTHLQYNILQEQLQEHQGVGEWLFDLFPEARVKGNVPATIHLEGEIWKSMDDRSAVDTILGLSKSTRVVLWDSLDGLNTFAVDDPDELKSLMFTLYARWNAQKVCGYATERLAWASVLEDSIKQSVAAIGECFKQGSISSEVYRITVDSIVKTHPLAHRFETYQLDAIVYSIVNNISYTRAWNSHHTRVTIASVSNLEWDVDDETETEDLPTEIPAVFLAAPHNMPMYSTEYEEMLTEQLTYTYNYCIKGYTYEAAKYTTPQPPREEKPVK